MQAHREEQQDHHENMQTWETAEREFQVEKGNVLGHMWLTTHLLHANSGKLQVVPDLGESGFATLRWLGSAHAQALAFRFWPSADHVT